MINLLIIGPYPRNPSKIERGVEAATVYLVEGLKYIDNLHIQIISCMHSVQKEETAQYNGALVHFIPSVKRLGNITFGIVDRYRIRKKIKKLNPDIIHNQYHFAFPYILSKPKCPIVTTVHGILHKEAPYENEKLDWIRKIPRIYLEKIVLKRVDHVICVTDYVKRTIARLTNASIYVIENPVNNIYFEIKRNEIPNRILFVGTIIRRKNILDLLKAIYHLKNSINVELHIVGIAEEIYYFNILLDYMNKHNLQNNVKFLGHLHEDKLLEEYSKCSVLILTSFEESAGLVIQQAMAAGIPTIATNVGGIPCIVKNQVTGFLVKLGDINGLANKIQLLLNNKEIRMEMGHRAKQEAEKRFTLMVAAKATYDVYQKLLNNTMKNDINRKAHYQYKNNFSF